MPLRNKKRDRDDDDFGYVDKDQGEVQRRLERGAYGRDSFLKDKISEYRAKEGTNLVRFLPPTWEGGERGHYALDIFLHYSIGAEKTTYLCPQKMKVGPCPICEIVNEAYRRGDEKEAKELSVKPRSLAYMIDRQNETEGVKAYPQPTTKLDFEVCAICKDEDTGEFLSIDHPKNGFDVQFKKLGKGLNTVYSGIKLGKQSKLNADRRLAKEWINFTKDNSLRDMLIIHPYEVIKKAYGTMNPMQETGDTDMADLTFEDIQELSRPRLIKLIERESLEVDEEDHESDSDLRDAITDELGLEATKKTSKKDKKSGKRAKPAPEPDEDEESGEEDEDELSYAEVMKMNHKKLTKLVDDRDLECDPDSYDEDDDDEMAEFREEVANELEIEAPKKGKKNPEPDEDGENENEEESGDETPSYSDVMEMEKRELKNLIEELELDTDPADFKKDLDGFRDAIAEELGLEAPKRNKTSAKKALNKKNRNRK